MQIYRRLGPEQKAFFSKAFYRAMGSDLASNPIIHMLYNILQFYVGVLNETEDSMKRLGLHWFGLA